MSVVRHARVDVHGFVGETVRIQIHRVVVADEPRVRVTVGKVEVILLAGEVRAVPPTLGGRGLRRVYFGFAGGFGRSRAASVKGRITETKPTVFGAAEIRGDVLAA